jgi:LysM repeat protein
VASKFIDQQYLFSIRLINLLDKIKYDSSLDQTKNTKKNLNEFTFKENIFFDAIAQFKSIDFYKIKRDNPFLLGQIIPKNCILNLDNEVGDFLTKNSQKVLNFQDSMIQNLFLDTIQKSKKIYSVKIGDFLGQIAIENNVTVNDIMNWNSLENTIIYQDQKLILITNLEPHGHEFFVKKISNEKYFWEILADNSKVTIKSLCTYNYYQELKPNQQLIITKK